MAQQNFWVGIIKVYLEKEVPNQNLDFQKKILNTFNKLIKVFTQKRKRKKWVHYHTKNLII